MSSWIPIADAYQDYLMAFFVAVIGVFELTSSDTNILFAWMCFVVGGGVVLNSLGKQRDDKGLRQTGTAIQAVAVLIAVASLFL